MKWILVLGLILPSAFVLVTSPVIKRWTTSYQAPLSTSSSPATIVATPVVDHLSPAQIKCDGRKYCSQMTSCSEAKSFLQQCVGTEMDGDGDGIPCESQWCH